MDFRSLVHNCETKNEMNIFFVVSACLWSWLVGRCIAFGPKCSVITWTPSIKHDSWYLLTTIPAKIPTLLLVFMPHIFTLLSVPTLFLNNTLTHSIMVIMLVSEHCYIPIFVTRIYDSIPQWSLIQIVIYIVFASTLHSPLIQATLVMKIVIWLWFLWIEIQIKNNIIREEPSYVERQPRTL